MKRTVEDLRARAAELAQQKKRDRKNGRDAPEDPGGQGVRERDERLGELVDQAHGVNLDLGSGLLRAVAGPAPAAPKYVERAGYGGPDMASAPGVAAGRSRRR